MQPKLLLVDEPTCLIRLQEILSSKTFRIKQAGATVVGIFHDLQNRRRLADCEFRLQIKQSTKAIHV